MEIRKSSWAEISAAALKNNISVMRSLLDPGTKICAVLKGNAYGLGIVMIKKYLEDNGLCEMFSCGTMNELIELNEKTGSRSEILVLGFCMADELEEAFTAGLISFETSVFSVWNAGQFFAFEKLAKKLGKKIKVHIRIDEWDSGMGLGHEDYFRLEDELFSSQYIDICGLFGHIYSSYDEDTVETERELKVFDDFVKRINPAYRARITVHVQNSALIFKYPSYSYDMARTGSALYGMPFEDGGKLKPVMSICGTVFSVHDVDKDVPLCYEAKNVTDGTRRIARVMIGYADCPMLLNQKKVYVLIKGRLFSLADEACMDNLCVDITGNDDVSVGDKAVLLGKPGVNAEEIVSRNGIDHVHCDWMLITAGRLEKVLVE